MPCPLTFPSLGKLHVSHCGGERVSEGSNFQHGVDVLWNMTQFTAPSMA
jgi:hypothetical protein